MTARFVVRCLLVGALFTAAAGPLRAQTTYKCSEGGAIHYRDRPCESNGKAGASGTTLTLRTVPREVPPHWRFMGPACRQLADSVRRLQEEAAQAGDAAPVHQRSAAAQEQYDEDCQEDEAQARTRAAEQLRDKRDVRRAELRSQRAEEERAAATHEQCLEMRRIRDTRRAQLGAMNAGERADFERFETNFTARCQRLAPPAGQDVPR